MKKIFTSILFLLLFIFPVNAQNFDWEWQNPLPTGADHNDAVVFSSTKLMLFGNGGSVLTSTDAGVSWTAKNIDPQNRDIYTVAFIDHNIGYVAGTGGLLMKTTDGGDTWFEQTSGVTVVLWDADFISADTGFVIGASGTILYTTNGGGTWSPSNYGTTTLYKIHFINSSLGFMGSASATTGRLLKTTNGGAVWTDISASVTGLAGTVRGIHFNDVNIGFVSNSQGRIFKTTDGGTSWSQVYDIGSTTTTIYEVKFADANNGYAISATGRVLKTTDGGNTWSLTQTAATKNLFGLGIVDVHARGAAPVLVGGDVGTILISSDNGVTWNVGHTAASQDLLYRVSFLSETVGYTGGGTATLGDLLKTTDGGSTWTKLPFNPGERFYSVHFLDENIGYAGTTGPTGLYKTTDGGQNWTPLNSNTGVSTSIIYDIKFFDSNLGFAMYSSGSVARTTDGGTSWTSVSANWGAAAGYNIFIVNASTIYLCGAGGRISKSLDGGASFFQLPSLGTATLYYLHFFDADNGYIAASGGRLYRTTNGTSFTETQLPVTSIFYSIKFVNNNIGWAGGASGNLFYTEDGGTNWTESHLSIGSTQTIRDIEIAGGRLWLVGTDGMIIRGYADPAIPVELASFSASVNSGKVVLNWITASELNNSGFQVERKSESSDWINLSFVPGKGTTTEVNNYVYTDDNPAAGINYYRLKQIDFDGTYEYSDIVEVDLNVPFNFSLEQNYPNPFNPITTINFETAQKGIVTLKVYNILGSLIETLLNEERPAGRHSINFNAGTLASGVYFYTLSSNEGTITKRMLLLK